MRGGCPAHRDLDHWLQAEADYLNALRFGGPDIPAREDTPNGHRSVGRPA